MEKKQRRSLEEILDSLKNAEKEYDEKLDKYGLKIVKPQKPDEEDVVEPEQNSKDNSTMSNDIDQEQSINNVDANNK